MSEIVTYRKDISVKEYMKDGLTKEEAIEAFRNKMRSYDFPNGWIQTHIDNELKALDNKK